jgi:hypothetical protein
MNSRLTPQEHQPRQPNTQRRGDHWIVVVTITGSVLGMVGLTRFLSLSAPTTDPSEILVADAVLTQYPPVSNWADLQTIHINAGNQTLYSIPSSASQTPEGIQRQLALIDQLSGFAQGAAAQTSLKQSRQVLELRMQRAIAGQPAFTTENP